MVPQPHLELPEGHTKSYGSPSVLLPAPGSLGPRGSGAHQPAPHTPALTSSPSLHLSAIPGGWSAVPAAQRRVPCLPALCHAACGTSASVLQSTGRASWAERRRHQERCHWWGGHIPTPGLSLPPSRKWGAVPGKSIPSTCPLGSKTPGGGRRAWGRVGCWWGLFLLAPSPCSVSEPPGIHKSGGSQVFPKKQLKIYPVWTDDLVGSWLLAPRQVGVRGRGQERGPLSSPPARDEAEVAAAHGSARTGRRAGPVQGSAAAQDTDGKRLPSAPVHLMHVQRRGAEPLGSAGCQVLLDSARAQASVSLALTLPQPGAAGGPRGTPRSDLIGRDRHSCKTPV